MSFLVCLVECLEQCLAHSWFNKYLLNKCTSTDYVAGIVTISTNYFTRIIELNLHKPSWSVIIILIFLMRKQKHREVMQVAQCHTANTWQSWDWNPVRNGEKLTKERLHSSHTGTLANDFNSQGPYPGGQLKGKEAYWILAWTCWYILVDSWSMICWLLLTFIAQRIVNSLMVLCFD